MNALRALWHKMLLRANGTVSMAKLTGLFAAVLNAAMAFDLWDLTPPKILALNGLLGALVGIFIRDAVNNPQP